jgi:hypothetical protein
LVRACAALMRRQGSVRERARRPGCPIAAAHRATEMGQYPGQCLAELGAEMDPNSSQQRFLVRQGTKGLMVWDPVLRGPAKLNGQAAIGLTKERADQIKTYLTSYYSGDSAAQTVA